MLRTTLAAVALLAAVWTVELPAQQDRHVHTDRKATRLLPLPKGDDVFHFVIFGDRTGGPAKGIKVLKQAVADTNLLDPDLVMTVGDLIQGYNETAQWMKQMREFRGVMNKLRMRWFPVAGNHDVYWRGEGKKPAREHEGNYEKHFGPLWYAFEHKRCWFVVLYTDEGDPKTGERTFKKPAAQTMSPKQLAWLRETLKKAKGADHVFLFLHHPRWHGGQYGDDWNKVHKDLVAAGNVSAVFAGHIHQLVYGGKKDGIEYYALAATGAELSKNMPKRAGFLHHYNLITVRKDRFSVASIPVGAVIDPKLLTIPINRDMHTLRDELAPRFLAPLALTADGELGSLYTIEFKNPVKTPLELTVIMECKDPRLRFHPDHRHVVLNASETRKVSFVASRGRVGMDAWTYIPKLRLRGDYLARDQGLRIALVERSFEVPYTAPAPSARPLGKKNGHLSLLSAKAHLQLGKKLLQLDGGTMTIEAFVRLPELKGRRTVWEQAGKFGYALWLEQGKPVVHIGHGDKTLQVASKVAGLSAHQWHHLAMVRDGRTVVLYLDGKPVASVAHQGKIGNGAVLVGAADGKKKAVEAPLRGLLDELRVSRSVRYRAAFAPPSRTKGFRPDRDTTLLLHLDRDYGPWVADYTRFQAHPRRKGGATCVPD